MKYSPVQNFINGKFVDASTQKSLEVISPLDGNLLSKVPMSSAKDLDDAAKLRLKKECRFSFAIKLY